jgi:hypothetical protein
MSELTGQINWARSGIGRVSDFGSERNTNQRFVFFCTCLQLRINEKADELP